MGLEQCLTLKSEFSLPLQRTCGWFPAPTSGQTSTPVVVDLTPWSPRERALMGTPAHRHVSITTIIKRTRDLINEGDTEKCSSMKMTFLFWERDLCSPGWPWTADLPPLPPQDYLCLGKWLPGQANALWLENMREMVVVFFKKKKSLQVQETPTSSDITFLEIGGLGPLRSLEDSVFIQARDQELMIPKNLLCNMVRTP